MRDHPERRPDEIYMGNAESDMPRKSTWHGRLGEQCFKADGTPLSDSHLRPWFILRSSVEAAIRSEESENKPWSAERIRVYRKMLEQ